MLLQYRQRHRADSKNGVMEASLIEPGAKFLFSLAAVTATFW
jgi:hypothetical protein